MASSNQDQIVKVAKATLTEKQREGREGSMGRCLHMRMWIHIHTHHPPPAGRMKAKKINEMISRKCFELFGRKVLYKWKVLVFLF